MRFFKRYYILIISALSFLFTSSTCVWFHDDFWERMSVWFSVENNDDDIIYVYHRTEEKSDCMKGLSPKSVLNVELTKVSPGEKTKNIFHMGYLGEHDSVYIDSLVNYIIIFRQETINKYSKKELAEKNICDTIYTFTGKQIREMGSIVSYP